MAAKFGATVVTVASVGVEDGVHQLLDSSEMLNSPVMGERLLKFGESIPQARSGVAAAEKKLHAQVVVPVSNSLSIIEFPPSAILVCSLSQSP